jgi:hypothetical protein
VPWSCTDNHEEVGNITSQNNVTFYISCTISMNISIVISRVELQNLTKVRGIFVFALIESPEKNEYVLVCVCRGLIISVVFDV